MAKRKAAPEYHTKYSSADRYLEDRRTGQFWPVEVYFPLSSTDRREPGNIDYANQLLHRDWRGQVPQVGRPNENKSTESLKGPYNLEKTEFQFVSDAPKIKNIPSDWIGTPSGIEPVSGTVMEPDDQQGYPTDNPLVVDGDFENDAYEAEFLIGKNIEAEFMTTPRYP
jgi:hypothetical protein